MKKLLLGITFIGLLGFVFPTQLNAENPCYTWRLQCTCDMSWHTVMVCDGADYDEWRAILCDCTYD